MGRWFFYNSLYQAHPHLETSIRLRQPIIGIGAPAGIFLPAVAQSAAHRADPARVSPGCQRRGRHRRQRDGRRGAAGLSQAVQGWTRGPGLLCGRSVAEPADERHEFEELGDALAHARTLSQERALGAASVPAPTTRR